VLAVFVLGMVTWGLSLVNVPGVEISVFVGALLIVAIAFPIVARRRREG
jgi:rhamnose transport system permease protein